MGGSTGDLCGFLGCLQPFLTPLVLLITVVAAWRIQLGVLARRAAWDFIAQYQLNVEWTDTSRAALTYLGRDKEPRDWQVFAARWAAEKLSEEERVELQPVVSLLNRYEFVGVVIANGTLHEKTYAQWWGWEYVDHWEGCAAPFVKALRAAKDDDTLFEYFEKVATSRKFKQLSGRN